MLNVPSVNVPPVIAPLALIVVALAIAPEIIVAVPSVTVAPCNVVIAVIVDAPVTAPLTFNAVVTFPVNPALTIAMSLAWKSAKEANVTVVPSPTPVVSPTWNLSTASFHINTALLELPRSPTKPMSKAGVPV